jgi:hypothetical protein
MEWLVVLAALACPLGMLAMGAIAWVVGKRVGTEPDQAATESAGDATVHESAVNAG